MRHLKKIVIIGPESTGKSTLCEQLAQHFGTSWCPEFAREFLLAHGTDYNYDDLLTIAKGQIAMEEKHVQIASGLSSITDPESKKPPFLFIDTNLYVMKVWSEFVFDKCHTWILDNIISRQYHLYLLCNTDLPWVKDELREYPDLATREKLYRIYQDLMINQPLPWVNISGNYEERLDQAIKAVEKYCSD